MNRTHPCSIPQSSLSCLVRVVFTNALHSWCLPTHSLPIHSLHGVCLSIPCMPGRPRRGGRGDPSQRPATPSPSPSRLGAFDEYGEYDPNVQTISRSSQRKYEIRGKGNGKGKHKAHIRARPTAMGRARPTAMGRAKATANRQRH